MIRPFTVLTFVLACGSGAYLFAVKHEAQAIDDRIGAVAQATRLDDQRIRVLQAQYALESDPQRIASLAAQFTTLKPMEPKQLVTMAALQAALPQPKAAAPGGTDEDEDITASAGDVTPTGDATQVASADDGGGIGVLPPPPAPGRPQSVAAMTHLAAARVLAKPQLQPPERVASAGSVLRAEALPPPRPVSIRPASIHPVSMHPPAARPGRAGADRHVREAAADVPLPRPMAPPAHRPAPLPPPHLIGASVMSVAAQGGVVGGRVVAGGMVAPAPAAPRGGSMLGSAFSGGSDLPPPRPLSGSGD